jgi:hypothetical protein
LRKSERFSFLRRAACCTVLRSRWYQNGVNIMPAGAHAACGYSER